MSTEKQMTYREWIALTDEELVGVPLITTINVLKSNPKGMTEPDIEKQAKINQFLLFLVSASSLKRDMNIVKEVVEIGNLVIELMPDESTSQTFAIGVAAVICTVGNTLMAMESMHG